MKVEDEGNSGAHEQKSSQPSPVFTYIFSALIEAVKRSWLGVNTCTPTVTELRTLSKENYNELSDTNSKFLVRRKTRLSVTVILLFGSIALTLNDSFHDGKFAPSGKKSNIAKDSEKKRNSGKSKRHLSLIRDDHSTEWIESESTLLSLQGIGIEPSSMPSSNPSSVPSITISNSYAYYYSVDDGGSLSQTGTESKSATATICASQGGSKTTKKTNQPIIEDKLISFLHIALFANSVWVLALIICARYYWSDFKVSSKFIISALVSQICLPEIVLWVAYGDTPLWLNMNSILEELDEVRLLLTQALYYLQPVVMLPHGIIFCSKELSEIYETFPEFGLGASVLFIFYLPFYLFLLGLAFQLDSLGVTLKTMLKAFCKYGSIFEGPEIKLKDSYDFLLAGIFLLYTLVLCIPIYMIAFDLKLSKKQKMIGKALTILCLLGVAVMGVFVALRYNFDFASAIVQGLFSGSITGLSMTDLLITLVKYFTRRDAKGSASPHNLFPKEDYITLATKDETFSLGAIVPVNDGQVAIELPPVETRV